MREPLESGPGPEASTGFWLHHAALAWQREMGRRMRPLQLTPTQFFVLSAVGWLGREGELPTQQEVAEQAGTDRMMTSKVLAVLETRGLVARSADPDDGRRKRLRQSAAGRELTLAALKEVQGVEAEFFAAADGLALRRVLATLAGL